MSSRTKACRYPIESTTVVGALRQYMHFNTGVFYSMLSQRLPPPPVSQLHRSNPHPLALPHHLRVLSARAISLATHLHNEHAYVYTTCDLLRGRIGKDRRERARWGSAAPSHPSVPVLRHCREASRTNACTHAR
ncbi:hypothetical protein EJ03DRAFT_18413 [Teratosphaeria nubilosa]|uniref:Uncharacterized protein n=1 Tax=Teratosphaeria nubilosa TaxID=161662 RepID=A0A6G1KWV9_9PEZI|nr:hypothetical protein EJ03DRAFT_18413 [Teratosphaeria nubilosa]